MLEALFWGSATFDREWKVINSDYSDYAFRKKARVSYCYCYTNTEYQREEGPMTQSSVIGLLAVGMAGM